MRVFVCGPYSAAISANRMGNVHRALAAGAALVAKGHDPFIPHLSHYVDQVARTSGIEITYEQWMAYCFAWLAQCDCLLFLAPSPGADRELTRAMELGLTIYDSVEDVPEAGG